MMFTVWVFLIGGAVGLAVAFVLHEVYDFELAGIIGGLCCLWGAAYICLLAYCAFYEIVFGPRKGALRGLPAAEGVM